MSSPNILLNFKIFFGEKGCLPVSLLVFLKALLRFTDFFHLFIFKTFWPAIKYVLQKAINTQHWTNKKSPKNTRTAFTVSEHFVTQWRKYLLYVWLGYFSLKYLSVFSNHFLISPCPLVISHHGWFCFLFLESQNLCFKNILFCMEVWYMLRDMGTNELLLFSMQHFWKTNSMINVS